ncbi:MULTISPECIES: molecular chaperone [unclassified Acinetobacter]|uniref:fimbrial biogenesis chaperone n=1 Tax=unclassified Acinetobacter TaxID=196816 RepID=UPI00293511A6|nr:MULTISPECIES: molecular chaperone [unclassified Acinetobacter]WOE30773.1 molecular chaperone [Acinetobacter sp. SAAs470]WOE38966.1 molecular chaperone [Acinetobacter sp. SAAs474]
MRLKSLIFTAVLTTLVGMSYAHSAIQALASRVIYDGHYKATTLALKNHADKAYMVQSWLEPGEAMPQDNKVPFVVTPPLVKIEPQKESILRFMYSGQGLAEDRESQFWINIQEIPPKPEQENVLQLAVRTKIKLFYRPKQLDIELKDAVKQLRWFVQDKTLYVENKSPLYVTIGDLRLGNQNSVVMNLNQDMIAPFSTAAVLKGVPADLSSLHYTYISEYGGNEAMPIVQLR